MPFCTTCRASIEFLTLAKSGARIPIDPGVADNGNIVVREGKAHVLGPDAIAALPPNTPRFRSHFVTCTKPEAHRKERVRG